MNYQRAITELRHSRPKTPGQRFDIMWWFGQAAKELNIRIPTFGAANYLKRSFNRNDYYIRWGKDGNEKMLLKDINDNSYAMKYVVQKGTVATSTKRLQIGSKVFWIEYISMNDWRANKGNSITEISNIQHDFYHSNVSLPMFAMDFVVGADGNTYMIDFDSSPGLKGTGVDKIINKEEVIKLLREARKKFNR